MKIVRFLTALLFLQWEDVRSCWSFSTSAWCFLISLWACSLTQTKATHYITNHTGFYDPNKHIGVPNLFKKYFPGHFWQHKAGMSDGDHTWPRLTHLKSPLNHTVLCKSLGTLRYLDSHQLHNTIREASGRSLIYCAACQQAQTYSQSYKVSSGLRKTCGLQRLDLNIKESVWEYTKRQKTLRQNKSTEKNVASSPTYTEQPAKCSQKL